MLGDEILAYLPERIKPYSHRLKQFPIGYEKWVYSPSLPDETYQGDMFKDAPFIGIDDDGDMVRAEFIGMIISNTCDVQPGREEFVLVAPVIDLEDYRNTSPLKGQDLENHVRDLTQNKISRLMFLPESQGMPRSFVDFGKISAVSLSYFHRELSQKRLLSFSQCGHYVMLIKLAYHLSRPEAQDALRRE